MSLVELQSDLALALDSVRGAFNSVAECELTGDDVESLARLKQVADDINRDLVLVREALDNRLGDALGGYELVVDGVGVVRRHKKKSRTKWDTDDLRRAVLDTRLVDETTGEVKDESPVDKLLHVWNLGAPRITALKERGLNADDFCHAEVRGGWAIEIR